MTMSSSPSEPAAAVAAGVADELPVLLSEERVKIQGPLRRLLLWMLPANLGVFILWGAIPGVLLPLQVAGIDEANKVANLALVTTIGAFAAMIAQPVAGAVSDRTRSRFGRRAPWMVAGALIGGLALVGMSLANGLAQIAIAWTMVQIAFNFVQGPLSAVLPDRVPSRARGTFAAVAGAAMMIGAIGGQSVGAAFAEAIGTGYVLLAGIAVIAVVLFVVFAPDASSKNADLPAFRLGDFLSTFWVNPVKHPDFFWAFTGRLLLYTGYFSVTGYNLYLLSDYVGLGDDAVGFVPVLGLVGLVGMLPMIIVSGPISDRLGRRKVFVFISSVVVGLALVIPWVLPTTTGMILMSLIAGIGFGAFQSVDQALMTEVLPSADSYAKDLGVVNIAATLPQTLAPAVGGAIVLAFGFTGLFPVGIVLSVLGAFAVFRIKAVR
ncbi:MFS transporter [Agromyces seonyuensis]|uniref:MFS transporter n=1 Tax=Agromyces seonyuensis TaxID=2662446 RepID=A0A6I4NXD3_9MICO|nr:MFS transporter [Agromyces seonyuensis]MWB98980.1 MFS transporter [Agromyces seonyuensis]